MEDPLDLHPMSSRRQGALFQRNPVCALCYRICMDMCDEQGGINFQLIRCLEEADRLCEEIVLNPWELEGTEEYYHKMERRLDSCQISLSCAFATVCVTLNCMTNLPEPVYQLAHDLRGLIIGEGNGLYNMLQQSAYRADISMPGAMYGDIPPIPREQMELAELKDTNAQLTKEVIYYKTQLEMKNEEQKSKPNFTIENHGTLTFVAEQKNDIHDNNNCPIYLMPEPRGEGVDERLKVKGERLKDGDAARVKRLFVIDGIEDAERTEGEKNRFLNYLAEHHWGKKQVDCYKDNPINMAIVCFCVKWKRLRYIDKPSPAAVYRFLTETCGLECASETAAITASLGRLLKADYDRDTFDDVENYF